MSEYDWQPDTPLPPRVWHCDMGMCPSQCYYHIEHDGKHWVLYLRWRWRDPWTAAIMKGAYSQNSIHFLSTEWCDIDLPYFKANQVKLAQFALLREWVRTQKK